MEVQLNFFLLSYCNVNKDLNLEYNKRELSITSPCILKMTYRENKLLNLEQINW